MSRKELELIPKEIWNSKNYCLSWAWWHTSVIPIVRRLRQEVREFKASLGYIARL
jgi:hypothetical protein